MDYADFARELAFYVKLHNQQPGRRTQMARGVLSFDDVWAEAAETALIRRATREQLRLALLAAEGVTVRKKTCQLHLADNIYFSEALWRHEGEKVIVRFDPEDLHAPIHVYRLDGVYVCEAACVEAIGFHNAEAAKEIGRQKAKLLRKAKALAKDQRLLDAKRVAALRPEMGDPEFEETNVVAPVFGSLALAMRPAAEAVAEDDIMGHAVALSDQVRRFKAHTLADFANLLSLLAQEYGAKLGGQKGNVSLTSHDGLIQVRLQVAERLVFGPELQAAKKLVDACLNEWAADGGAELRGIVQHAFNTDKEGLVNRAELFRLLRYEVADERWQEAMRAIKDSIRVEGTKEYVRFYRRPTPRSAWEAVTIDVAAA